jgi:multidrug efflux system outer membrane protein
MEALQMRRISLAILLGSFGLFSGCVVGPKYTPPTAKAPPSFRGQEGGEAKNASIADLPWWEVFQDQTLQVLVRTAIANNLDLRIAATRVEQARELAAQARSQYLPSAGYQVGVDGGKNESSGLPAPNGGNTQGTGLAGIQAVWDIDLWGKIRHMNEAALAEYVASEQGRRGVLLSLVSSVAQGYYELLELDLQLEIAHRTADSLKGSLKIFEERLEGGKASRLETARAQAALATTAAQIPDLERRIALKENEINLLLGNNPGPIHRDASLAAQSIPPEVPAGLPSTLLERRPDVLQAEQAVRAANAQIGIATAAFFPNIGLTAVFGRMSSPLANFTTGSSNIWGPGLNAIGPLFTGGLLRSKQRQAVAAWEEAKLHYQQTALGAFRDVSGALITRQQLEAIRAEQIQAVTSGREAVEISTQRYNAGKSSYYEVLAAQQELFPAENALAQTEFNRRLVIVQLYQALGGGWNLKTPEWAGTPAPGAPAPQSSPAPRN